MTEKTIEVKAEDFGLVENENLSLCDKQRIQELVSMIDYDGYNLRNVRTISRAISRTYTDGYGGTW
jgi:hypothetical protein